MEENLGNGCLGSLGIGAQEGRRDDGALESNKVVLRIEESVIGAVSRGA